MKQQSTCTSGFCKSLWIVCFLTIMCVCSSFSPATPMRDSCRSSNVNIPRDFVARYFSTTNIIEGDDAVIEESDATLSAERDKLKRSLIALGASFDRGFGASPSSRKEADRIVDDLEKVNPTVDAAQGISGDGSPAPLEGIWRMVWTDAQDVLSLAASPLSTVGAIYQVIEPPIATNIIDLIPRAQALLPPGFAPPTLVRAEVTTRASLRSNMPMRVGLTFESVKLKPVEIFGFSTMNTLPPLSFDLPRIPIPGGDSESSPGYFDVAYLDDEMLVIRQNAPGGYFALIKVPSYNP
uniref:Plastid lipid-associated protein/fibrillin conserved domain-containing protein n=1 Tax=Ditylum brightwellii TaxID=49249 RepID=A0A6S8UE30_9STRA